MPLREARPHRRAPVAGLIVLGLAACQPTPPLLQQESVDNAEQAGNVFVSAYPAVPWSDIADKLAPANNMTITEARNLAAQTTEVQVQQFLSTFAAGLALTLPSTTQSFTTTTAASGAQTTQGTRTTATGQVPASSGAPSAALPSGPTPDLSKAPPALGIDGSTLLTAGTALYQQAQILDSQISKQILPEGYQAHLVTFQINLQPKRRDLAYDAYTDLTLLPGDWNEAVSNSAELGGNPAALAPVKVYPLVIADALETTNVGRTIQTFRQAALQLSGIIGGAGVSASAAGGSNNAQSIYGLDKNSLVTAGRVSDSTIRIRLGAENSGSAGLAMVPRSYNVSVVVLTRWEPNDKQKQVTELSAIAHTTFVSAIDGTVLKDGPQRQRMGIAKGVETALSAYGYAIADACVPPAPPAGKASAAGADAITARDVAALNLLRAVDRGDYGSISRCLGFAGGVDAARSLEMQRLIAALTEHQVDARYATMLITLQRHPAPTPPDPAQLVLFADDQAHSASAVLRGGKGLDAKKLGAALMLKDGKTKLMATGITMIGDGSEVDLTFPSLKPLGIDAASGLAAKPLVFSIAPGRAQRYAIQSTSAEAKKASNPVQSSQTVLVADAAGTANVTLQVGDNPKDSQFKLPLHLAVAGADVRVDKTLNSAAPTAKGVALQPNTTVTLALGNLTPARPVTVTTLDNAGKPVGDPITFTVDRAPAK